MLKAHPGTVEGQCNARSQTQSPDGEGRFAYNYVWELYFLYLIPGACSFQVPCQLGKILTEINSNGR